MATNQKASEVIVASDGQISVAPYGTALPSEVDTSLNAAFVDIGYVTTDGVQFSAAPSSTDIDAWQSATAIRRITTGRAFSVAFTMQQWNQETVSLAFGGGTWTMVTPGSYRFDPPSDVAALTEYSVVVDAQDGTKAVRYVVKRATMQDTVNSSFTRTAPGLLPVTFQALTPDGEDTSWYLLSDAAEFSIAS